MPEITETELKRQIEKSEFTRMYFLYGEEKYMIREYAKKLVSKAYAGGPRDFNLQRLDGAETDVQQIASAVEAMPVMAERKCVEVSDLDAGALRAGEAEKLWELLGSLPESCVLVMDLPSLEADVAKDRSWKKFLEKANKAGATVSVPRRSQAQMEKLLCAAAQKRGCSMDGRTAAYMVSLCGGGLQNAINELEKLCAYVGQGEITKQTVDGLTTKNLETRVFDLSRALLAGSYDKAYSILNQLFYQNEEPVAILTVLSGAYLDLYRVKASVQSGLTALEPAKHFDYARKEFRLTNAERTARDFSVPVLRQCLDALCQADLALKGARGDRRLVLEKLLARLIWISEGGGKS